MIDIKPFNLKFYLLLAALPFLVVGCTGEAQTAMTTGAISIARRGESLLTPESQIFTESSGTATPTPEVAKTPEFTETPEVTPTTEVLIATDTETATVAPTETSTPEGLVDGDSTSELANGCQASENRGFEAEVIALVNKYREENGIRALAEQSQLTQAARLHSQDMACNQFFSHVSNTSGTLIDRIIIQDYQYSAVGENIAAGYLTATEVVESWMSNSGHKANLMNPQFTQIGVGYIYVADSQNGSYWTIIVGSP